MSGHVFPNVVEVSAGSAQFGDNFITNLGTVVQLNNEVVDIDQLINSLKQTTRQCEDLRKCLQAHSEPFSLIKSLASDIEELEARIDTLKFHLEDNDLSASQGWQRSLIELEGMTRSYQRLLRQTQTIVQQQGASREQDVMHATAMRYDIRRLRLKLDIAIGVVTFCIYQRADPDSQLQEVRTLHERLRIVLEHIENEKALTLGPTKPLTSSSVKGIQDGGSELMQRFVARTIDSDQATLREASMRVSTFMEGLPPIGENEASQPKSSKSRQSFSQIRSRFLQSKEKGTRDRTNILRDFSRLRLRFYRTPDPGPNLPQKSPSNDLYVDRPASVHVPLPPDLSTVPDATKTKEYVHCETASKPTISYETFDQNEISSPEGIASGQSEQLPFFKDYYSHNNINPGDEVSVLWAYQPRANDELQLEQGDMLHVIAIWDDGWAVGVRITDRAADFERSHKAQTANHLNDPTEEGRSQSPSGETKAFPLVCVCLPEVWRDTIFGNSSNGGSLSYTVRADQGGVAYYLV